MPALALALSDFLQEHKDQWRELLETASFTMDADISEVLACLVQRGLPDQVSIVKLVVEVKGSPEAAPKRPYKATLMMVEGQFLGMGGLVDMRDMQEKIRASIRHLPGNAEAAQVHFLFEPARELSEDPTEHAQQAWELLQQHLPALLAAGQSEVLDLNTDASLHPSRGVRL